MFPPEWFPLAIPRVTLEDLALPGREALLRGGRPFVITNALRGQEALVDLDESWVARRFGSCTADFYPNDLRSTSDKPALLPAADALHRLDLAAAEGRRSYAMLRLSAAQTSAVRKLLTPGYPALFDSSWWTETCLPSAAARDNAYLISAWSILVHGVDGSGFFLHWDSLNTGTFQIQIKGTKHWVLCDPKGRDDFYDPGDVDAFAPDLEAFPRFRRAVTEHCAHVAVRPGEAVFYPSNWWHATRSEGRTVGFVGRTVTRWNHAAVFAALSRRCADPGIDVSRIYKGEAGRPAQRLRPGDGTAGSGPATLPLVASHRPVRPKPSRSSCDPSQARPPTLQQSCAPPCRRAEWYGSAASQGKRRRR